MRKFISDDVEQLKNVKKDCVKYYSEMTFLKKIFKNTKSTPFNFEEKESKILMKYLYYKFQWQCCASVLNGMLAIGKYEKKMNEEDIQADMIIAQHYQDIQQDDKIKMTEKEYHENYKHLGSPIVLDGIAIAANNHSFDRHPIYKSPSNCNGLWGCGDLRGPRCQDCRDNDYMYYDEDLCKIVAVWGFPGDKAQHIVENYIRLLADYYKIKKGDKINWGISKTVYPEIKFDYALIWSEANHAEYEYVEVE